MARVEAAKKLQTIQKSSQLDIYGYGPKKGLRRIFQPRAEKDLESNLRKTVRNTLQEDPSETVRKAEKLYGPKLTAFITKTQGTEELITWIDPEKSVTPKQEVLVRLGIALDFAEAVKQQTDGKAKDEEIVVSFTMLRPGFDGGSVSEAIQRVEKPDFLEVHKATQALARREFSKEIAATTEKYFDIPGRK